MFWESPDKFNTDKVLQMIEELEKRKEKVDKMMNEQKNMEGYAAAN